MAARVLGVPKALCGRRIGSTVDHDGRTSCIAARGPAEAERVGERQFVSYRRVQQDLTDTFVVPDRD